MNLGIDLGTTYSLAAALEPDGTVRLIPDHAAQAQDPTACFTPSSVLILSSAAVVGAHADELATQDPEHLRPIRFFKRLLGSAEPVFHSEAGAWLPESVAALVLRKLADDARADTPERIEGVVVTVPAHFNAAQRMAVKDAADLAGLPAKGLLEEPVAAAMFYGVHEQVDGERMLLAYDLGGGTFDATIMRLTPDRWEVVATDGITDLGGKEFDQRIAEMIEEQFKRALGSRPVHTARVLFELYRAAERLKILLCAGPRVVTEPVTIGGKSVQVTLRRSDFEQRIAGLVEQTEVVTLRCLQDAGVPTHRVDTLLMVGGSSMIPLVRERIGRLIGVRSEQLCYREPTRAVACGAALHMAQLVGTADRAGVPGVLVRRANYSLGVRTLDVISGKPAIDVLIEQGESLPCRVAKRYYTARTNQQQIFLEFVQTRRGDTVGTSLGEITFGPLPLAAENYLVIVEVHYDENGTVAVSCKDPRTQRKVEQVFEDTVGHGAGAHRFSDRQRLEEQRRLVRSHPVNPP